MKLNIIGDDVILDIVDDKPSSIVFKSKPTKSQWFGAKILVTNLLGYDIAAWGGSVHPNGTFHVGIGNINEFENGNPNIEDIL